MEKGPIRVLVFGETGTGKTSLCNTLSNQVKPVSDRAVGVTFQSQEYLPFIRHNKSYILIDTVGLNEGDQGTVRSTEAFKNLLSLIRKSEYGYNIFVHVARGKITKSLHDNYKFFAETVAQKKIPVILVVTGCENKEPMSLWEDENRLFFEKQGFEYKEIIATCFAETQIEDFIPRYEKLRAESKERLLASIENYALEKPEVFYRGTRGFVKFMKRLWNGLCELIDTPSWKAALNKSIYELLKRMGFSDEEAKDLTNENE